MLLFGNRARRAALADTLIDVTDDGVVIVDQDHNIVRFNPGAEKLFGFTAAEVLGQPLDLLLPERFHLQHGLHMDDFAKGEETSRPMHRRQRQIFGQRKDGAEFVANVQILKLGTGRKMKLAAIIRDMGRDQKTEEEMLRMAAVDPLTGAYNRREFTAIADREALRAGRYNHPLSVLLLDLDDFRRFNDLYGTTAGDIALQSVAELCAHALRTVDVFGRWSGKEFIALLPETPIDGALIIAERLRRLIADTQIPVDEGSLSLTVSIGVAQYKEGESMIDAPLARADSGLMDAKRAGGNRVVACRT